MWLAFVFHSNYSLRGGTDHLQGVYLTQEDALRSAVRSCPAHKDLDYWVHLLKVTEGVGYKTMHKEEYILKGGDRSEAILSGSRISENGGQDWTPDWSKKTGVKVRVPQD